MSKIYEQIRKDIIVSMKEKNGETNILRNLDAAIQLKKLDNKVTEITDAIVIDAIVKGIKQREESIISFKQGNRQDLVDKEEREIEIYKRYQPEQLTEDKVILIIEDVIKAVGATSKKDMGNVMKVVTGQTKGLFDGKRVSELVKERL
ncbi:MAG: GatB/YqeY domain-containing protein [Methanothrix sp.]|jgi:hypothetical protein|nr:GatB/YqeY domain-containing protein [Methanothrix sp.]